MTWQPSLLLALAAALVIDRIMGDPPWIWSRMPHPVAAMGRFIGVFETRLNDGRRDFGRRRALGAFTMALLLIVVAALAAATQVVLRSLPFGIVLEALLVAVFLAQKSLVDHVEAVARGLASGGLPAGRSALSHIVGRDVTLLDEAGVARAAIESVAENFSDGVVAPVFWYMLLGLPGLFVYKLANTADSMIGYRSSRHEAFGWAAARLDDFLNLVPARLSVVFIAAAALARASARAAICAALRDASRHRSPNAGWPEAAIAGALGLALGGPRRYGESEIDGAWLNPAGRSTAGADDIRAALRLIDAAWGLLLILIGLAALITFATGR